jgi:hypothetical protein
MNLENEVRLLRGFQIDELHDAIIDAGGDLRKLSQITTTVTASARIADQLMNVASYAADQAIQEAERQGVTVARQDVSDLQDAIEARADALDQLLRDDIVGSAIRQATRLTGGGLSPAEVAEDTRSFLIGMTGLNAKDMLGGGVQQSINSGRKLVFTRDGADGIIRSSELLDTNTCAHCVAIDGTEYDSIEAAEHDYPTGGYKNCDGRERCRGTLIKVYAKVREPSAEPASQ